MMRSFCVLFVGLLLLSLAACRQTCLVPNPCGTGCVAAPMICRLPCGTVLQGEAAGAADGLLDTRVAKVDWDELMISEVLGDLQAKSGVEVFVDHTVWSKGYDQARITLHAEDVTVGEVLTVVFAPFDLQWTSEGGKVVVRPKDGATP